jgi:hypothetical protein
VCHRKFRGILITVLIARYTIMWEREHIRMLRPMQHIICRCRDQYLYHERVTNQPVNCQLFCCLSSLQNWEMWSYIRSTKYQVSWCWDNTNKQYKVTKKTIKHFSWSFMRMRKQDRRMRTDLVPDVLL